MSETVSERAILARAKRAVANLIDQYLYSDQLWDEYNQNGLHPHDANRVAEKMRRIRDRMEAR